MMTPARPRRFALMAALGAVILLAGADDPAGRPRTIPPGSVLDVKSVLPGLPDLTVPVLASSPGAPEKPSALINSAQTMALFALMSLAPAAVLMVTAFVRISIVLTLLRQALGSPQVPGNQVLMALALLLTALVMRPVAESTYERGIRPYLDGKLAPKPAWEAGSAPIKAFMIAQMERTRHLDYCDQLYEHSARDGDAAAPRDYEDYSLAIVAPAYLLSELTTALFLGFAVYLPFLVIDLVVSAVLGAMGLFMLPPAMVALPLKLILFALADGWMLVSGMLLRSFGTSS